MLAHLVSPTIATVDLTNDSTSVQRLCWPGMVYNAMGNNKKSKPRRPALLSHGRPPPIYHKPSASLSSKATRTLIRSHHQLNKALTKATGAGDTVSASDIQAQIERQGGLQAYQAASITGQNPERGGDSSKVLLEWLAPLNNGRLYDSRTLRMLEVGALRTDNACSRCSFLDVTRIDLHAQTAGIMQQDFNQRPLPETDEDRFDIISLSLVLNYVPDASGRGVMLKRICSFLRALEWERDPLIEDLFPSLFLVLPAPCVNNSRYLTEKKLMDIMGALGFVMVRRKMSAKLVYYLWEWKCLAEDGKHIGKRQAFQKKEIRQGGKRNNFAIVLE